MASNSYRVMQYNVLHQKAGWTVQTGLFEMPFETRAQNVANAIKEIAPDVVLLSERHDEWAGINTGAVAMENGAVSLLQLLGDTYAIAEDQITHNGVTAVNRVPIVYNKSKLKLVDSGFIALTEEYSFELSQNKRVVTWAIFEDISGFSTTGEQFAVFNTHWSIQENTDKGVSYADIRAKQSKEMQALINDARFQNMPRIVGGDFNAQYHFDIFQELLVTCGLTHTDMEINGEITWDSVDHIAVTGAEVSSYALRWFENASDHPPIYADIVIKK